MAASRIQSIWKGALVRRRTRLAREKELEFIGMVSSYFYHFSTNLEVLFWFQIPPLVFPTDYQDRLAEIEQERRAVQDQHQREYEEALVTLKDDLRDTEGDDIEEDLKDEIRKWFFTGR